MVSVRDTGLYKHVLKECNYAFGNVYMFKDFVVSEFFKGETITWDNHAKIMIYDIESFYDTDGSDVVYISNRINSYSVVASDWLKFYKSSYKVKAYCIVSEKDVGFLNSMIEKLFFKKQILHFTNLLAAVNFVEKGLVEIS
ncbi:hypothetical protein [Algibacter sp. R77976]|uniref:hypothetical protein n=1 Tax=Algibacter sp. R77976 TaxID=3093873 RepID=UPI0037C9538A